MNVTKEPMDDRHCKIYFRLGVSQTIFEWIHNAGCGWQRLQWSLRVKHLTANNKTSKLNLLWFFLLPFPTVPTFRWLLKVLWNTQTNNISLGAQSQPQPRRDVQDIRKEPFFQIKSFFNTNKVKVKLKLKMKLKLKNYTKTKIKNMYK